MRSLFLLIFLFPTVVLFGQKRFESAVFIGGVASQVEGDNLGGFDKPGLSGGFSIQYPLKRGLSFAFDLSYIQKGSRKVQDPDNSDFHFYKMSLHYAEVPVYLNYQLGKLGFFGGFTFGVLLAAKEEDENGDFPGMVPFNSTELGFVGGFSYKFNKHYQLALRFQESISSIRPTAYPVNGAFGKFYGQYNTVLNLALFYRFR